MDWSQLIYAVAAVGAAALFAGQKSSLSPKELSAVFSQTFGRATHWWSDYQALLVRARELDGKDNDNTRRGRRAGGWSVSPLQAFRNIQDSWADPGVKRLMKETLVSTPWSLVIIILFVSLGGSFVVIRRAGNIAGLFDVLATAVSKAALKGQTEGQAEGQAEIDSAWSQCVSLLTSYVVLHLVEEVIDVIAGLLTDELRMRIELRARKAFFTAVLSQDISYLESQKMTDMQRHLHEAPFAIHDAALVPARLVRYFCTFLAGLYSMIYVDWQMAIMAWVFRMPMTLNLSSYTTSLLALHWRLAEEVISRSNALVNESLANVRLIQIHAAEEIEANAYARLLTEGHESANTMRVVEKSVARVQNLLHLFWDAGSLGFAAWRIVHGNMTIGSFNAFKTYQNTTASSFEALLHETSRLKVAARKCEMYFDILDRKPTVLAATSVEDAQLKALQEGKGERNGDVAAAAAASGQDHSGGALAPFVDPLPKLQGQVEFVDVSFRYPKTQGNSQNLNNALSHVNFRVPAGSTAAFVGKSGAGKSTLLRLLIRFYDPSEGCIKVDGKDVRELNARNLRRQIGFVEQEPTMLNRTIKDNICYGFDPNAPGYPTQEEIENAARRAYVHQTITSFPDGYNTIVGDRGVRLSGGEKQRIAVARAFVRNPSILLLDEPTAALDSESETMVKQGIEELMKGRTVLIIAHRLRTVQSADRIYVFDQGEVIENGSHEELLRMGGHYASLVAQQVIDTHVDALLPPPSIEARCSPRVEGSNPVRFV